MRTIERLLERVVAGILGAIAVLVLFQVVARYGFGRPPSWTEELARYLQVWLVMLAAPLCLRRGMHLAIDYLTPRLVPGGVAFRVVRTLVMTLVGILSAVLAYFGIQLLPIAALQRSPALGISMVWAYLVIPVAGLLMTIEAIRFIVTGTESPPRETAGK